MTEPLSVAPGIVLPAAELAWTAVRARGAGGQNVNKVSTKVKLRFDFEASAVLPDAAKARLRRMAGPYMDAYGALVVSSDRTRSQSQNLELARSRLAELVRAALHTPKKRRATRPSRASRERRLETKRRVGEKKRGRREGRDG